MITLLALFHRGIFKICCHHRPHHHLCPQCTKLFGNIRCLYHHHLDRLTIAGPGIQLPKTRRIFSLQLLEKISLVIWYYKHLLLYCVHIVFLECWFCYGSISLVFFFVWKPHNFFTLKMWEDVYVVEIPGMHVMINAVARKNPLWRDYKILVVNIFSFHL